jgi:LuxR family maltose regulon positive regulatory protein
LLSADPQLLVEHRWLSHTGAAPSPAPTDHRGLARAGRPEPAADLVVEALTARELEVLHHLEELLTTEEIAEKMFVSVNTVRTHVRGILRKMGVNRRNAAVRKGRDLGLLDA